MAPSTNNGYVIPNISQTAKNQENGKELMPIIQIL